MRVDPKPELTDEEQIRIANWFRETVAIVVVFMGTFFFFVKILFF